MIININEHYYYKDLDRIYCDRFSSRSASLTSRLAFAAAGISVVRRSEATWSECLSAPAL